MAPQSKPVGIVLPFGALTGDCGTVVSSGEGGGVNAPATAPDGVRVEPVCAVVGVAARAAAVGVTAEVGAD